jgi:hypothetical protein
MANLHWFVLALGSAGMMVYFKWVEHQRDILFTKLRLPMQLSGPPVHVD